MPAKQREQREPGYRISIQIAEDVLKLVQRQRQAYRKVFGFPPSRSAMINIMLRSADRRRDWLDSPGSTENNQ